MKYKKAYPLKPKSCEGCVGENNITICNSLPTGCSGDKDFIGEYIWVEK